MMRTRLAAAAAVAVTGGAATMLVTLVCAPGPWWQGYVSEAGSAGQPYAVPYRWGLLLLAGGVAVLGWALRTGGRQPTARLGRRRDRPGQRWWRRRPRYDGSRVPRAAVPPALAAMCLGLAAGLAATSALVPCSNECPLPPYQPTTVADVVHTAASVLGMLVLAGAMAATWLADPRTATRRLAAGAVALTVPVGGALGLAMLLTGRSPLGAVLERLLLVVAVSWLVATALLTAFAQPRGERR